MPIIFGTALNSRIRESASPEQNQNSEQWTIDLSIDDATSDRLTKLGLGRLVKKCRGATETIVTFSRSKFLSNGIAPNRRIPIVDHRKEDWTEGVQITDGSMVAVNFSVSKSSTGLYPTILAVQVIELADSAAARATSKLKSTSV